jgi:hypothetical protein
MRTAYENLARGSVSGILKRKWGIKEIRVQAISGVYKNERSDYT